MLSFLSGAAIKKARKNVINALRDDAKHYSKVDLDYYLQTPEVEKLFVQSALELYSRDSSLEAQANEYICLGKDWGFDVHEIQCPVR